MRFNQPRERAVIDGVSGHGLAFICQVKIEVSCKQLQFASALPAGRRSSGAPTDRRVERG
jgi:hypothetical protein